MVGNGFSLPAVLGRVFLGSGMVSGPISGGSGRSERRGEYLDTFGVVEVDDAERCGAVAILANGARVPLKRLADEDFDRLIADFPDYPYGIPVYWRPAGLGIQVWPVQAPGISVRLEAA